MTNWIRLKADTRKMIACALALGMLLTATSCAGTPDTSSGTASAAPLTSSPTADPLSKYEKAVTLKIGRTTMSGNNFASGDGYENNPYTRWAKDALNIKVEDAFEAQGGDNYNRQVSLRISTGDIPDAMLVSRQDFLDLASSGMIADLTDLYNQYASDRLRSIYDSYDGRALDNATIDGKLMALPSAVGDSTPAFVYVRKDWIDSLGIKFDADGDRRVTPDEIGSLAKTFLNKDPGKAGKPVGLAFDYHVDNAGMTAIANSFGAYPQHWLKDSSGKVFYGATSPEMKKTLSLMADWKKQGVIDPQFGTRTTDDIKALLVQGQLGIVFGTWDIPGWYLTDVIKANKNAKFEPYAVQDSSGAVNAALGNPTSTYLVVSKKCANPEAVIKLFNLQEGEGNLSNLSKEWPEFNEDKQKNKCSDDGKPFYLYAEPNNELILRYQSMMDAINGKIKPEDVKSNVQATFNNIYLYYKDPASVLEDKFVNASSNYVSYLRALGLKNELINNKTFHQAQPVFYGTTDSMQSMWSNLNDLEEQAFIKIITGSESVDYFDKFVQDWNSMGGQQITQEVADSIADQ
jgi:putative aldouronate transport system substrate-binding protein